MICGVNIGGKDTLEEWGLMLCNDLSIGAAVPRYRFINIPEMSGALDLTEALTGSVPYDQRQITFTLFAVHDVIAGTRSPATEEHFQTVLARFSGFANGKRLHLYLPDNPDHYFVGRVSVGGKSGYNSGRVKVEVLADPYRLKDGETTLTVDDDDFFKTATPGALVTFDDGGDDLPMKSCVVSLVPKQDLNGYDSPWPGGGGVNLLPPGEAGTKTQDGITVVSDGNGKYTISGTSTAKLSIRFNFPASKTMPPTAVVHLRNNVIIHSATFVLGSGSSQLGNVMYSSQNRVLDVSNWLGNATISWVQFYFNSGVTVNATVEPMVCTDSTVRPFSPYSNICPISGHTGAELNIAAEYDAEDATTYSVTFTDQGAVYGGTYDFVTGKLTVTHAGKLGSEFTWQYNATYKIGYTYMTGKKPGRTNIISSAYKTVDKPSSTMLNGEISGANNDGVNVKDDSTSTLEEFQAAVANVQFVYELATPLEYDLTPQEVTSLLGENNVWSNDGDISELVYMFTDEIIINNEGMPAIPTINASEAGPTVTLRGASHVLAAGDNRFSDFILQSGENVMQVEDPAGTLTIKYQEGML